MLGDWLVVSQVLSVNPAAAVRGPKHVVTKGATPVLSPAEAAATGLPPSTCCHTFRATGITPDGRAKPFTTPAFSGTPSTRC